MPLFKSFSTRVGDFSLETLDTKAKPQRLHSMHEMERAQREEAKMRQLHKWVLRWVDNNLDDTAKKMFYGALGDHHYGEAHDVLISTFHSNGRVKFSERRRFDQWIGNFDRGFQISS